MQMQWNMYLWQLCLARHY